MAQIKAVLNKKDELYREQALNGSIWKAVLYIGTPLALYQTLNQLFKIFDTMMAAHISEKSVSAVAYLSQISFMLLAIGQGLAIGAGIQISRAYGEGDFLTVKKRVSSLYVLCLAVSLVLLAGILPFTVPFLRFIKTPEDLIAVGAPYFALELITMVLIFLNNVYIAVERARGNSKRILYMNLFVILTKFILTAIFVYILNGDLIMISFATMVSQFIILGFAIKNSLEKDNAFGFSISAVSMERDVNLPVIEQSLPVIVEKMAFSFGKAIVNSMSTAYGALMVGALGISNNIGGMTTMPQDGFKDGGASIISQNLGAKKYSRVLKAFYAILLMDLLIGVVSFAINMSFLGSISRMFSGNNEEFRQLIMAVYRFEAWGAIPLGANAAVLGLLYGLGKTKITLFLNFARVFIFRVPILWYLQRFTSYGEKSIGMVMMISNVSSAITAIIIGTIVIYRFKRRYKV